MPTNLRYSGPDPCLRAANASLRQAAANAAQRNDKATQDWCTAMAEQIKQWLEANALSPAPTATAVRQTPQPKVPAAPPARAPAQTSVTTPNKLPSLPRAPAAKPAVPLPPARPPRTPQAAPPVPTQPEPSPEPLAE